MRDTTVPGTPTALCGVGHWTTAFAKPGRPATCALCLTRAAARARIGRDA